MNLQTAKTLSKVFKILTIIWICLFGLFQVVCIIGFIITAPDITSALKDITSAYSPFNVYSWILTIILLSPAFVGYILFKYFVNKSIQVYQPNEQRRLGEETVEELENFPFMNFAEFKKAYLEGIFKIGVDRGAALDWAHHGGRYASRILITQTIILSFLPFLVGIGFLIYAIVIKAWFLLLALPILLIGFFIFHPSGAMVFGFIRSGFILLTLIGFIWALFNEKPQLLALTIALLVIWYAQRTTYNNAVSHLIAAAAKHEDLLCLLWQGRALRIRFHNGNTYLVDRKIEDGNTYFYD